MVRVHAREGGSVIWYVCMRVREGASACHVASKWRDGRTRDHIHLLSQRVESCELVALGRDVERFIAGLGADGYLIRPQLIYDAPVLHDSLCSHQDHVHPALITVKARERGSSSEADGWPRLTILALLLSP